MANPIHFPQSIRGNVQSNIPKMVLFSSTVSLTFVSRFCVRRRANLSRRRAQKHPRDTHGRGTMITNVFGWMREKSALWWMPIVLGTLTCVNTFVLVLSGPLTALFFACAVVRPFRSAVFTVAACNALGSAIGCALLYYLIQNNGESFIRDTFPQVMESDSWALCKSWVDDYGIPGALAFSTLPIVLHPLVLLAALTRMNIIALLVCVSLGRFVKYSIMCSLAIGGGRALTSTARVAKKRQD